MAFFLEYVTDRGAGRFTVGASTVTDAVAKAKDAIDGIDCTSAALRHTPHQSSTFGDGSLLAAYTRSGGWTRREATEE